MENNINPQETKPKNKKLQIMMPLLLSLAMILGMYIGVKFDKANGNSGPIFSPKNDNPMDLVLKYIDKKYVDTVNRQQLYETGISEMLDELDPYSAYIPARYLQRVSEPLDGNFEGIGIEFYILDDTLMVVSALSGGPSEKVGIRAGDKIILVDDENIAGIGIQNEGIVKKLRGKKNTKVKVSIFRKGEKDLLDFTIKRDKIPIYSLDVAYMLDNEIGYIKINKFSATTAQELNDAFEKLENENFKKLVLDLRGNPGGYLDAAVRMADEFLEKRKLITYTKGRTNSKQEFKATSYGHFEKGPLVILIDEGSASASEIVSGAVQDSDRGIILGRRSFGKGLVQEQYALPNGSALRLTVSKYYTPTGRSIQKSYMNNEHDGEINNRIEHGELFNKDSIKIDKSLKFETPSGRIVYGGGGIIPDVFVPFDSTSNSELFVDLRSKGIISQFAYVFANENRTRLDVFKTAKNYVDQFQFNQNDLKKFAIYALNQEIEVGFEIIETEEKSKILSFLKAHIGRQIYGNEAFFSILNQEDKTIQKAIDLLKNMNHKMTDISNFNLQETTRILSQK